MFRHCISGLLILFLSASVVAANQKTADKSDKKDDGAKLVPLNKKKTVLLDVKGKRVLLKAKVVLRADALEMLICPIRTKEHESILAVDSKAYVIHTGLLAVGAKPGKPATFEPKFQPPTGQEIEIYVRWKDKKGKLHRVDARKWVRTVVRRYYIHKMKALPADLKLPDKSKTELRFDAKVGELFWFGHMTVKQRDALLKLSADPDYKTAIRRFHRDSQPREMDTKWVFAGSGFEKIDGEDKRFYLAERGSLVCMANFSSAMIDVAQESSAQNGRSLFEAHTERIPPIGTEVTVELVPVFKKPDAKKSNNRKFPVVSAVPYSTGVPELRPRWKSLNRLLECCRFCPINLTSLWFLVTNLSLGFGRMTRSRRPRSQQISSKRRNLTAILISFGTISVLYFNFDPTPAGGDIGEETVNVAEITKDVDLPTSTGGSGDSGSGGNGAANSNSLKGKTALLMNQMLLERGMRKLDKVGSYSATFYRRERVAGRLLDAEVMKLKMRHEPFSVYMKWVVGDKGRELLFVKGQHKDKMLVKLGGVKGRLIPVVKLTPDGDTAMEESRHPVTEIGLMHLAKTIIAFRQQDLALKSGVTCRMFDNQVVNDVSCFCFVVEYANEQASKMYRKSVIFIDKETHLPICVKNFTWPEKSSKLADKELDKDTLIEDYRYSNIQLDQKLADNDFDRTNSKYRLRR
eukprot:g8385.t1